MMANLAITSNIANTAPIDRIREKQRQNKNAQDKKEKGRENREDKVEISSLADLIANQPSHNREEKTPESKEAKPTGIGDLVDIKA